MGVYHTTVEGIRKTLGSLKDFSQMLRDRRDAHEHHELNILVVKGKWYLDQFGQVGYLILQDQQYRQIPANSPIFAELGDVATEETFRALGKKYQLNYQIMLAGKGPLPSHISYCAHCGAHWYVDNLEDYETRHETIPAAELMKVIGYQKADAVLKYLVNCNLAGLLDENNINRGIENLLANLTGYQWRVIAEEGKVTFYQYIQHFHMACMAEVIRKETAEAMSKAVEAAGYKVFGLVRTQNRYGSLNYRGHWLVVDTQFGLLRLGWRKRVINIDYSMIDKHYSPVTDETSGPGFEHVYGYEKLTQALATFRLYIESKKNFEVIIPHLIFGAQIE